MFRSTLAYRHDTGEVEGFIGWGFALESAEADCIKQMQYKIGFVQIGKPDVKFEWSRVITDDKQLSAEELAQVRADWKLNMRYTPDGTPCPGGNEVLGCFG